MDRDELDAQLDTLRSNAHEWATLDVDRKIDLLDDFMRRSWKHAERQVREAVEAKGLEPGTAEEAEEWLAGPVATLRTARHLRKTLESIQSAGRPPVSIAETRQRSERQLAVDVFPQNLWDRMLYQGFSAEVWLEPEVDREHFFDHTASFYQKDDPKGGVALVLGAGNVASIPPLDVLHKLYVDGETALLKVNPVNEYLGPIFEDRFEAFIDAGYVEVTYGGAEVGNYLCEHAQVDSIHITGSDATHDAIVFGTGEEGERRQKEGEPKLDKPITSELGNVSPVIVVPGPWTEDEIQFHAENLATQLANNGGFNCNAVRVIVTPEDWEGRDALLDAIVSALEDLGPREAYYRGAEQTFERFTGLEVDPILVGDAGEGELPYAILPDLDPEDEDHPAFRDEAWCTVTAETRLPGDDPGEFLRNAIDFCNEVLWGTLSASIIIHPETERDISLVFEEAVEDLVYGSVVINHWPGIAYGLGVTPWGGYPGYPLENIQSGRGFVHNALMFDKPQKSVVRGPFTVHPKPPWFATNDSAADVAPKIAEFELEPSIGKFLSLAWSTFVG